MLSSARSSARSTSGKKAEDLMVIRREREYDHQVKWDNQVRYYKSCENLANKFQDWTSPRYYETSNQKIAQSRDKRQHEENLAKRREKLKKLYEEEERSFQIELMVRNCNRGLKAPEVPADVLKDVNTSLKLDEEERRRHEAEEALYNQWRSNNTTLLEHKRNRNLKNLKLSWLDQQIEKRLERERAEESCRKAVEERNKRIEKEKENEERLQKEILEKKERWKEDLEKQIVELHDREQESTRLQEKEQEEKKWMFELRQLEEERLETARRNNEREIALENIKMHKLKLKHKADYVKETIDSESVFIKSLLESEMADRIADEAKKNEIKIAMKEFLKYASDQQDLERKRRQHFDFVFDSEAKDIYEKQRQIWLQEQRGRQALLQDVWDTVKQQIDENVRKNKDTQIKLLEERKNALKLLEEYDTNRRREEQAEELRREQWKKDIDQQIIEKRAKEAELKTKYKKRLDLEMENARKEEERLQKEIVEMQRRQGPIRHARSRILF